MKSSIVSASLQWIRTVLVDEIRRKKYYIAESLFFDTFKIRRSGMLRLHSLSGYEIYWWSDERIEDVHHLLSRLIAAFEIEDSIQNFFMQSRSPLTGAKEFIIKTEQGKVSLYITFRQIFNQLIFDDFIIDREKVEIAYLGISKIMKEI